MPNSVDLTAWFPPVVNQRTVPLCTAAVAAGIAGFYARRNGERDFTPSVLFNYRTSRLIMGDRNRAGSTLLRSFDAWNRFGMLEEEEWPFTEDRANTDPPPRCFRRAAARRGIEYDCVFRDAMPVESRLRLLKEFLVGGVPVAVDIPLHPVQMSSFRTHVMPLPPKDAKKYGRHVVVIAGYDDRPRGEDAAGAFLIRNSWGSGWAADGYGWLPYSYLNDHLIREAWVVSEKRWTEYPVET
ncbi:C1 family peptidase [Microbispora sp. NPDC049633]|uniref:C1 family peptidase n=1 Tax=Microbispora sp. NPDC049633 TaxID=3154355 RepID=UPI00341B05D6